MTRILFCTFFFYLSLYADKQKITLGNSNWQVLEHSQTTTFPVEGAWKKADFKATVIPGYKGKAPTLTNDEVPNKSFPTMLTLTVGSPSGGILRTEDKGVSRYLEFINDLPCETDNNLEYLLELGGRWSLKTEYRTNDYIIHFNSGAGTWVELIVNGKIIAAAKGSLAVQGSDFPESGKASIKCSSVKNNNKGLISVKVYKVYETFMVDPFGVALQEKWFMASNRAKKKWSVLSTKVIKKSGLPETTAALYRRVYNCANADSARGVCVLTDSSIKNIWVNGQELDLNFKEVPEGVFREGDNEVIYYSHSIEKGLKNNLKFESFRPCWLKMTCNAKKTSVISGSLRGVSAKLYINGQYAGVIQPEKSDEFLGLGYFREGQNEIALCILQSDARTYLEELTLKDSDTETAHVLPWRENKRELSRNGPGLGIGYYLNYTGALRTISTTLPAIITDRDFELVFDSGKRFPAWMFKQELHAPLTVSLNGQEIERRGHSFTLPAEQLKKGGTLTFQTKGMKIPEPLLYTSSQAKAQAYVKVKRTSAKQIKPGVFFVGDELNYQFDWDSSFFDKLEISFAGKVLKPDKVTGVFSLKVALAEEGSKELSVHIVKGTRRIKVYRELFEIQAKPQNLNNWLTKDKIINTVAFDDSTFYMSESTLFPEAYKREWVKRERLSDGDQLNFGPLQSRASRPYFSLFDSFPNGVPVFEKFGHRLETYFKIRSRGYPAKFTFSYNADQQALWKSAAFTHQYLLWLESQKMKIDWTSPTLKEVHQKYVIGKKEMAAAYLKLRIETVIKVIKVLVERSAPGSTFEEVKK